MQKFYSLLQIAFCICFFLPQFSQGQNCSAISASCLTYESRCAATGSIKIIATGGSGSYKYKTIGPVNTNFTTTDSITGLSAGTYTVVVNDIATNCTISKNNIVVAGAYQDPRFTLTKTDVSCDAGNNGSIMVNNLQYGRAPFAYTIVAPSAVGVGTTNNTGIFTSLIGGNYNIKMTDSCGGIQTRQITVNDYTWWISSYVFNKISCDSATGSITVKDSHGNVSTAGGIPGFTYGIVRQPGDTVWSSSPNFTFNMGGFSTFTILARDNCGKIKTASVSLIIKPFVNAAVNVYGQTCNSFSASLNNITNFFNGDYCLYNSSHVLVACNSTGIFTNLVYGDYCINAHDPCTDTIIKRCFTATPPLLSINNIVAIENKTCSTFSARITGQVGLTSPSYCLYNSANVLVTCNTIGLFNSLAYGYYCIKVIDGCRDTTITNCFTAVRPTPVVTDSIIPSYITCTNFGIIVNGDSLTNPQYCLYSNGVEIICNSTGVFDSIPFGSYCVNIYDACYDTTIIRCFGIGPVPVVNDVVVSIVNKTCSTFSVNASSTKLIQPNYCLYNNLDVLIGCNSTGVFDSLAYGSYCLKTRNSCPDTTLINCFSASPSAPSINAIVDISDKSCTTFTAKIGGQQNLTNPQYCIFDKDSTLISCDSTGEFYNLPYGAYCIKIINTCYDTTLSRCFTASPDTLAMAVTSNKSCYYGYAKLAVSVVGGSAPINIKIYDAAGNLFFNNNYNSTSIAIDSIQGVPSGAIYKVIATDNCGKTDSVNVGVVNSMVNHFPVVISKCPGGSSLNGSGDIQVTTATNMGSLTIRIISKNGTMLSPYLSPDFASSGVYTFNDLGPATYVIRYKANDQCGKFLYDTVNLQPYQYPNLNRSSAYQCDVNGFSIGAVATNGVSPFTYEVIGSVPSAPSIIAGPQSSPIFYVDNGTNYSLVRLRALDACGNATLGDASILPLAINGIVSTQNCLLQPTTLTVDTIYNSTYQWYKKADITSTDSIYLGSGYSFNIPFVTPADTGLYVCHIVVNSGCINKTYYYSLNGACYTILSQALLNFTGNLLENKVLLHWNIADITNLTDFVIERKNSNNTFTAIGNVSIGNSSGYIRQYDFLDTRPDANENFYRLKLIKNNNTFTYSNIILLNTNRHNRDINIYPNPVTDVLNIDLNNSKKHVYKISLLTAASQLIETITFNSSYGNSLQIARTKEMVAGIYILRFNDLNDNSEFSQKITFR